MSVWIGAAACGGGHRPDDAAFEAGPDARRFSLTGRVVSVEASEDMVTVAHDEVEGFMEAMTMQFAVKERWALEAMAPNDRITATLVVDGARSWLQDVVVTRGGDGGSAAAAGLAPAPGTAVPDPRLVDQDEQAVRAEDFTERVSVVTFIYTRCPLPDYCPLMMQRFTEAAAVLRSRAAAPPTEFLPVTVDPEYDTPAVLHEYAARHVPDGIEQADKSGQGRVTWRFLTGTPESVRAFARFFGLVYERQGDQIMHALRTAVIDPQGRVVTVLRGNEWSAEDLVAHIDAAAEAAAAEDVAGDAARPAS